jgi:uncharacterized protein (TIGR03067 family)
MRSLCVTLLAGSAFILSVGCGKKGGTNSEARPSLDGTYLTVESDVLGKRELEGGTEAERTFIIRGDKMIAMKGSKEEVGTFKTDDSKSPAHIDITPPAGDGPEKMYGIYKLEGDTLTICVALSETPRPESRPKEFKSTQDAPAMIMVMKKKK